MPIVPLLFRSVHGSNYNQCFIAYQLIIQLSCCEISNDVNSFLLTVKQHNLPELEMVVSSSVADA